MPLGNMKRRYVQENYSNGRYGGFYTGSTVHTKPGTSEIETDPMFNMYRLREGREALHQTSKVGWLPLAVDREDAYDFIDRREPFQFLTRQDPSDDGIRTSVFVRVGEQEYENIERQRSPSGAKEFLKARVDAMLLSFVEAKKIVQSTEGYTPYDVVFGPGAKRPRARAKQEIDSMRE